VVLLKEWLVTLVKQAKSADLVQVVEGATFGGTRRACNVDGGSFTKNQNGAKDEAVGFVPVYLPQAAQTK
jgi:hypothetical protein